MEAETLAVAVRAAVEVDWRTPTHQFLDSLLDCSPHTFNNYARALRRFEGLVGPLHLAPLDEILQVIRVMKEKYAKSSLHSYCAALRQFLRFIGREDDAARIPRFNSRWLPPEPPTPEQIDKVLKYATLTERALILTFYSTGARCAEIMGDHDPAKSPVHLHDIDWGEGRIRIIGKGGHADYLVFWLRRDETIATLLEWLNGRQAGPLFPFCDRYTRRLVRRAGARVGVKLWPHLLRHACATSLLRQGADSALVNSHLRHIRFDTTRRYLQVTKQDLIARAREREWR
jgi:site-specific recombinase XerD